MKILHVIPSLNPSIGGTVEGVKQLVNSVIGRGHEVEVATLDDPISSWLLDLPFPVHALGPGTWNFAYSPKLVPWLQEHAEAYDAVIIEGLWQYHSYATWKAMRKTSVPFFVFTHGMLDPWFKTTYPLKHLKKWIYWLCAEYRVLRDAKAVLFTSDEERILSRQSFWLYRCNEVVVGYGTVRASGSLESQRNVLFKRYPNLCNKRLVLYLGRIHEKKGCDLLIESFARVAVDPALHLIMAGPDQTGWKKHLVRLSEDLGIADRITWTGMLEGDMKWSALRVAEVFILPSHQENFGVVVAEALSCGLPVLISNKVNIWREVEADGAGIVGEDTFAGTVKSFKTWLGMDALARAAMRDRAVACFQSRFDISRTAKRLVDVVLGTDGGIPIG